MFHFSNLAIEEQNKIREVFLVWKMPHIFNCEKGDADMGKFGGKDNKPDSNNDKFSGLGPGQHMVYFNDMNTGISDKSGKQYWIMKFSTEDGKEFDHFMPCEADQYKTEEQVYNKVAKQMEALFIYDTIGEHDKLENFIQAAIDKTYMLKGKKIEYTIQKWKMDNKEGLWGAITGYLDTPNTAIQRGIEGTGSDVDSNEEIPF